MSTEHAPAPPATDTEPVPVQAERSGPPRLLWAGVGLLCAGVLGMTVAFNATPAFAVVVLVLMLPLLNARPVTWVILTISLVWLSRVITAAGVAPRFLDFIDFPLAIMSLVSAGLSFLASRARASDDTRAISRALLVVAGVTAISWAFSSPLEPQRLIAGWVLTFEPFLVLLAVLLAPMTERDWRRLCVAVLALLAIQIPFSLGTIALGETGDAVKGTLLGAGAGHHVSAGGLAVGFFLLVGLRTKRWTWAVFGGLAFLVMVVADAKQVLFLVPVALVVLVFSLRKKGSVSAAAANLVASVVLAVLVGGAVWSYASSTQAFTYINLSVEDSGGKVALAPAIWNDIAAEPDSLVFGLGPGESVSRFAFLTTPSYRRTGNPAAFLNMHGATGPQRYTDIVKGGAYTGESSFTSPQSSAFGILGDYGLVGTAAFVLLIGTVLARLRKVGPERRGVAAAALASWTLLLPLAVIFDWLEQPPFTLAVIIVTGLALRAPESLGRSTDGSRHRRSRRPSRLRLGLPTAPERQ